MCVAAIGLEDVAALQLAQPSLGKMAVKEPAQPFWCYIPRLARTGWSWTDRRGEARVEERFAASSMSRRPVGVEYRALWSAFEGRW